MRMTEQEFRNERLYNDTMIQVKKLLHIGLISLQDYWQINTKMKAKYRPISDGLVSENELLQRYHDPGEKTAAFRSAPGEKTA